MSPAETNKSLVGQVKTFIRDLGFPIFVAVFMLWDRTSVTQKLISVIERNTVVLESIGKKLGVEVVAANR